MTLETIVALVDWQAVGIHTTRQGKRKPVLTGIPTKRFWEAWKADKLRIRDAGLSLSFEKVHKVRETATGQSSRAGGSYRQPRQAKSWTVTAWINPRNAPLVAMAGFDMPEDQEPEPMGKPLDPVIELLSAEIDCPF